MRLIRQLILLIFVLLLAACSSAGSSITKTVVSSPIPSGKLGRLTDGSTSTSTPSAISTTSSKVPNPSTPPVINVTPVSDTRLLPENWQEWPVVPTISSRMIEVYQQGQVAGHDSRRFSKIGDCQNVNTYFLYIFDKTSEYSLGGEYAYLQATIDYFIGSWSRKSQAVRGGWNVASVLSPILADPKSCQKGETPLACEIRINNPSIVIISMETSLGKPAEVYEGYMRQVVEYTLSQGVVPILATKADNLEGDNSINAAIARVAYDYEVPLWNFWAAVQTLPHHGLSEDGFHLTFARNIFDDPIRMINAWPWRNLTALESIDAVYHALINTKP